MNDARLRRVVLALHRVLVERHLRDDGLVGPDPGIRVNYRAGRFVKSYLRNLIRWHDDLYYLQAQGYWMLANWHLVDATGHESAGELARACAGGVIERQRPDGAWDYPNPEWRGRVANAEGTWAALGLIEGYRRTRDGRMLDAVLAWHRFLDEQIGYQAAGDGLAVNYFAGRTGGPVPNNSVFTLRLLAELADASGDPGVLEKAPALLAFIAGAQRPTGELPYQVPLPGDAMRVRHFQCYQYAAFAALDLIRYTELTGDAAAEPLAAGLMRFLLRSVGPRGDVAYACSRRVPHVSYHAAVVAAALRHGDRLGVVGAEAVARQVLSRLLELQEPDGGFPHSRRDYGVLTDRRSYPRYLAMMLEHLLFLDAADRTPATA